MQKNLRHSKCDVFWGGQDCWKKQKKTILNGADDRKENRVATSDLDFSSP